MRVTGLAGQTEVEMDAARLLVWLGLFFVAAHAQTGEPQSTHHAGGDWHNGGVGCRGGVGWGSSVTLMDFSAS